MLKTWTHGIDNTHGIDLDSWYRIGALETHTYKRAACCKYARFFNGIFGVALTQRIKILQNIIAEILYVDRKFKSQ